MGKEEDRATAAAIKLEANELFKRGKYKAAVDKYTEAITFAQTMHVLFVNRALCHRRLEDWESCERDSRTALGLNSSLMKASYFLGVALRKQLKYAEAAKHLDKALAAANEAGDAIKDDVWREVAACKFSWWQQAATVREDKQARLKLRLQLLLDSHYAANPADGDRARDERDFEELFDLARQRDKQEETDSAYTCTLTMEPFREPVCTPDGNSYERAALLDHLAKVGAFEPITRNALNRSQVIPNRKLRTATLQYLDEHPWNWEECTNPTY